MAMDMVFYVSVLIGWGKVGKTFVVKVEVGSDIILERYTPPEVQDVPENIGYQNYFHNIHSD